MYLAGEIHSDWRERIAEGVEQEVDRAAMATAETPEQVVEILRYATLKE